MKPRDIILRLESSELKSIHIKEHETAILGFINSGITEIYKKFPLWREEAIITPQAGKTDYDLLGNDPDVTISLQNAELLMVDSVVAQKNEKTRTFVPTNEPNPKYVSSPKHGLLRLNEDLLDHSVSAVLRVAPSLLTSINEVINLPIQFFEPLVLYAAYKGHTGLKGGIKEEGNLFFQRFTASCNDISINGEFAPNSLESTKFEQRGYP